ncbi:MAG: outer membrane protein assembly factor BamA [Oligosphaeraceae bacterium]
MKMETMVRAWRCVLAGGLLACAPWLSGDVVEKMAVISEREEGGYPPEALAQRVYHLVRTQTGQTFSEAVLNDDIKQLMLSGSFESVRVERVDLGGGRLGLNFFVQPRPMVRSLVVRGSSEYSADSLLRQVEDIVKVGAPAEERAKAAARKKILEKYQDAGYWGTEVSTLEEPMADGQGGVQVVIVVKEKARRKLEGTYFQDATAFPEDELRDCLYTKRQWWRYIFRFGNYFNDHLLPLDSEELRRKYHNAGYLDFELRAIEQRPDADEGWVQVWYLLQEGQPYTVSRVAVQGAKRLAADELARDLALTAGQPFSAEREQQDIRALKARYGALGYLEVQVWANRVKDAAAHTVAVEYQIREGDAVRIRDIKIVGNEQTREKVIRRELAIQPDDLGDPTLLEVSKARLQNLGYFSQVDITPAVTGRPDLRDLRISLEEKPTGNVSLGAAFSTEDSVLGQFEFTETNFDLQKLLAMEWPPKGGGQRFRSRVQVGSDLTNILLSLDEPWFLDRRLTLSTELFLRTRSEDEYEQRNIGAQVMLSWPFAFRIPFTDIVERNWRMGAGLRLEHVRISDCDEYDEDDFDWDTARGDFVRDRVIADEEGSYWANRLIWRVTRDTRDAYRFPTSGTIVEFQTEYVTKALGSYEDYLRFSLGGSHYVPLPGARVLKLGLSLATTTDEDKVAIFDRYFAGGVGTIRGFKRRDVAPVDRHEDPFGGSTMMTGTIELLQPVRDILFASVFTDFGNVWYDAADIDLSDLCMSIGVGVQFRALPISLYYGYPIVTSYDHLDGRGGRFHFSIGFSY